MYADGIKTCRTCGKAKPVVGFTDEPVIKDSLITDHVTDAGKKAKDPKSAHRNANNRKLSRLPKEKEGKFYISTFKK